MFEAPNSDFSVETAVKARYSGAANAPRRACAAHPHTTRSCLRPFRTRSWNVTMAAATRVSISGRARQCWTSDRGPERSASSRAR